MGTSHYSSMQDNSCCTETSSWHLWGYCDQMDCLSNQKSQTVRKRECDEMDVCTLGVEFSTQKHLCWPCVNMFHDEKDKCMQQEPPHTPGMKGVFRSFCENLTNIKLSTQSDVENPCQNKTIICQNIGRIETFFLFSAPFCLIICIIIATL